MSKKHLVFIINPNSGINRRKEIKNAIDITLDLSLYSYEIIHTEFAKHGTELAREAARNKAYCVVAVGGDGSVNDIVNGLMDTETLLAIIPKGSGNGMARTIGIPLDTIEALKLINKGKTAEMDLAFANNKTFISNAGVAFDALISKKFAKSKQRGLLMYAWLITKHLWLYKEWDWHITIDGKEYKEHAFVVNIANGQQFGYNFKIAPTASYTDGVLDIVIIRNFPKILGAIIAIRGLTGSLLHSPFVKHYTGKEITITHPSLRLMQTDGDAFPCENKIIFTIKKGAQKVIVP